jgi:hypothetical protein
MYKIVGGDQREYGPITSDQVREWIAQGRANGQTLASFEGSPWKPLSTFPEFADALRASAPPTIGGVAGGSPYAARESNGLAIAGLIISAIGLCCCFPPLSLAGIVLSFIGLNQIKKSPERYVTSTAVPVIGIVLGLISAAFFVVLFATGFLGNLLRDMQR